MRKLCFLLILCWRAVAADLHVQIGNHEPLTFSVEALESLPHQTVQASDHGGNQATWTGVPLYQVLQHAGLLFGESLRGPALSQYVLVTGADGYQIVLALPELDPRSTDDPVLLCETMNGGPLPQETGPLRLVLPKERRHYRWVRQVVKIEVHQAKR